MVIDKLEFIENRNSCILVIDINIIYRKCTTI